MPELWRVLQACVIADVAIIIQASNTGLTGGSTPDGDNYDREVVIISTRRLKGISLIEGGKQVVCLPGSTLTELEDVLKPMGREPHSVLGSSCIGASVLGGISNNSGGALIRRGPAYTELALFARLGPDGRLELVNHLNIELGDDPLEMLERLQQGKISESDVRTVGQRQASDTDYGRRVRDIAAPTPARFNADPARLHEASGCAGKLAVFAVRLDTFKSEEHSAVFYIGSNSADALQQLRRRLLLDESTLPEVCEYIHRDAFAVASRYGKDMFLAVKWLGARRISFLLWLENRLAALATVFGLDGASLVARFMVRMSRFLPQHLPARLLDIGRRFEHQLLLKASGDGIVLTRKLLAEIAQGQSCEFFECDTAEAQAAFLHRFVVAGAAKRYCAVHVDEVSELLALDIALPRNTQDWFEVLPPELDAQIAMKIYYGHFVCQVFHQDYVIRSGNCTQQVKQQLLELLDARGAEYPAEHNVGHFYAAKPGLKQFYQMLDPCNRFNPGIGQTSRLRNWQ